MTKTERLTDEERLRLRAVAHADGPLPYHTRQWILAILEENDELRRERGDKWRGDNLKVELKSMIQELKGESDA